jgi:hypothetical protein
MVRNCMLIFFQINFIITRPYVGIEQVKCIEKLNFILAFSNQKQSFY